jgi:hypothetical protein
MIAGKNVNGDTRESRTMTGKRLRPALLLIAFLAAAGDHMFFDTRSGRL